MSTWRGAQVVEYGGYSAVGLRVFVVAELGEDRADVFLDGRLRQAQGFRDSAVGEAAGHLPEDVSLAVGQPVELAGLEGASAGDQCVDDARVQRRPSCADF